MNRSTVHSPQVCKRSEGTLGLRALQLVRILIDDVVGAQNVDCCQRDHKPHTPLNNVPDLQVQAPSP